MVVAVVVAIRVRVRVCVRVWVWVPPRGYPAYFERVRSLGGVDDERLRAGSTRRLVARLEEKLRGEFREPRRVRHGGEPRDEEFIDDGDDVASGFALTTTRAAANVCREAGWSWVT